MIEFKTLKYKHVQEARALQKRLTAASQPSEADQLAMDDYVFSLVKAWDFTDEETGQPVPVDQPGELTISQYNELFEAFNAQMAGDNEVKKNERRALTLWLNAIKRGKEKTPEGPEWLEDALLCFRLHKLPHELGEESLIWMARLKELQYQANMQGVPLS